MSRWWGVAVWMILVAGARNSKRSGISFWARRERFGGVRDVAAIGSGVAMTLSGALLIATGEDEHAAAEHHALFRLSGAL